MVINHKIHPKHLEIVQLPLDIQFVEIGLNSISRHLFHLRKDVLLEIVLLPHKVHVQVPLELTVRQLISWLVPTIVLPIFLNRIICKMHIGVAEVLYVELVGTSPYIPLRIPVRFQESVSAGNHHVVSYVEFTVMVQKWLVDVRLDYVSLGLTVRVCFLLYFRVNVFTVDQTYSSSSVTVLPWL